MEEGIGLGGMRRDAGQVPSIPVERARRVDEDLYSVKLTPAPSERKIDLKRPQPSNALITMTTVMQVFAFLALAGGAVAIAVYVINDDDGGSSNKSEPQAKSEVAALPSPLPSPSSTLDSRVAVDNDQCRVVGEGVLGAGGNAVDAAVATVFCLTVTHPYATGLGGDGVATVAQLSAKGEYEGWALDFRGVSSPTTNPAAYLANPALFDGPKGALLPTLVKGMRGLHAKAGSMDWESLVAPAIGLARTGFAVSHKLHAHLVAKSEAIIGSPPLRKVFAPDGTIVGEGARVVNDLLADSLESIAHNPDTFYTEGAFAEDIDDSGLRGFMPAASFAAYSPVVDKTIATSFLNFTVLTAPPPHGGLLTAIGLRVLNNLHTLPAGAVYPTPGVMRSPEAIHALAETMKHVFGSSDLLCQIPSAEVHQAMLERLAAEQEPATAFRVGNTTNRVLSYYGTVPGALGMGTGQASLNVRDAQGTVVSLTTSMGSGFGSGIVLGKSGVVLNDQMRDFALDTNHLNYMDANRKPASFMSPTIALKDNEARLAIGGGGGAGIVTSVLQVANAVLSSSESPSDAVDAPRIHAQLSPPEVMLEVAVDRATQEQLIRQGHRLQTMWGDELASFPFVGSVNLLNMHGRTAEAVVDERVV